MPVTIALFGTFFVTTDPAPTKARLPIVSPGRMTVPALIEAPSLTSVSRGSHGRPIRGYLSVVKVTLGPMNTLSCTVTPVGIKKTNGLILQLLPIATPSSKYTNECILQFLPQRRKVGTKPSQPKRDCVHDLQQNDSDQISLALRGRVITTEPCAGIYLHFGSLRMPRPVPSPITSVIEFFHCP